MMRAAYDGTVGSVVSHAASFLTTPIQRFVSATSGGVSDALRETFSGRKIARENEQLREENAALREQLVDYGRYKAENEQLREYLAIKESNPEMEFVPASVIGRDTADRFYSFTIDSGSKNNVKKGDPVVTSEGLVGFVSDVSLTSAKVLTLLDVSVSVGAMDSSTRETGVTMGTVALSMDGCLRLSYLPRESQAAPGDIVATTGIGGLCPKDLVIGTVREVVPDAQGLSLYAVVEPPADLRSVSNVLVITSFDKETDDESAASDSDEPASQEPAA
jgi:rod shape-determining protein MreC